MGLPASATATASPAALTAAPSNYRHLNVDHLSCHQQVPQSQPVTCIQSGTSDRLRKIRSAPGVGFCTLLQVA